MVEVETKNVLNPNANDFLFIPIRTDADKMPNEINPKIINNPITVSAIPAPTQAKINPIPIKAKKASPGEESSIPSYRFVVFAGVVSD